MRIRYFQIISFLLVTTYAQAQSLQQNLQTAFNRLQQDSQCKYASISLTVLDAQTGETVFTANPDMGLAPASTLKTVTSITAFNLLGKNYQYQTQLGYSGSIDANGVLNGDVIIKGGGDPTLASWRWASTKENVILSRMVAALKQAGIKQVNGRIVGDDSLFDTQSVPDGWIWQDMGTYYGAGTSALCWRENSFDVKYQIGPVGSLVSVIRTVPDMPYFSFKSEVKSGPAGSGDQSYPYLPVGNKMMYIRGHYAVDKTKKTIGVALPDPAYDAAWRLSDTLKRIGINVTKEPESSITLTSRSEPLPVQASSLTTIQSPVLSQIVHWLNRESINLYAEQLLKTLALQSHNTVSTQSGVETLQNFWKVRGIDVNSLRIYDGSGLSPGNRVTTSAVARILQSAVGQDWYPAFYESLPLYNNMKMKSGTIGGVVAYAGYQTHDGRRLCFSVMINNYNGSTTIMRQKLFKVLDELK
ncbi:D-alanyl-D-alanine carboxypeptidase/D-alanyl-D-alanine-endopeptidase [Mucilaginibacter sp. Bleaf8]|uniref:D-alanyl-D-alanine carboxypeptidase/D-alanyl-D-alanine endopeptidase n=1 Tax=Mucilaginibacter sp. Bleaf8 TaxID=2834430 RepID=UPI001BCC6F75|nr:D-alanyl-D-alanine carboxypeptidase/D-alanyl-D-alanine-endopeptidase [Mucilaginibacter sp. Bleaf8]MBS7564017.1 D-alanyl-D-alanine carboxypeptidase/D-alanyl-D-alanine-endopeptidase [Mucilaginibacter sp. Bleaf8]